MYSILLVDDEKSIREHLTKVIPFEEHGFLVENTAQNGKEAFEKLPLIHPDLILLDVRMPIMDGLEFLKVLRSSEFENTNVVILSGYNEFEYAKEAMKYGVKAYLNKPVDEDEILPLLDKVRKELDRTHKEKEKTATREYMKMFNKLYNGGSISRSIFKGYTIMYCVLLQSVSSGESNNIHLILQDCLTRVLGELDNFQFRVKGSQYSFLFPLGVLEHYDFNKELLAEVLSEELKKENLDCAFLFDSYVFEHSIDTFREDISNHNYEMLTNLFYDGERFIDYSSDRNIKHKEPYRDFKYLEDIKQHLLSLDKQKVLNDIEKLMNEMYKEYIGIQYVQEVSYRIYYLITDEISENVRLKQDELLLSRPEWIEYPYFISFEKWKEMLCSMVIEGFEFIERSYRMINSGISREVIEYIHLHYMEQISLKQVAERFYTNAAYLGRVFQKATGVSFKEYVNKIRITEAKKLLLHTNMLIYEIATQVGFTESSYFIVKFTQEVGKSPTEYRNIL